MVVMTAAALHLLFAKRMMGRQHGLGLLFLMAGKADIGIAKIHHLGTCNLMGFMAFIASHTVQHMRVSPPVHRRASLMTGQAHLRALLRRQFGKAYYIPSLALGLQVLAARPVTGLASPLQAFQFSRI